MVLMRQVPVQLNRYRLRPLLSEEKALKVYRAILDPPRGREELYAALARLARKAGGVALGERIVAWNPLPEAVEGGRLVPVEERAADPRDPRDRKALERLFERKLEGLLRRWVGRREGLEREGLSLYRPRKEGPEDVQVYDGVHLGLEVDGEGWLLLAVELTTRLQARLSLEDWIGKGHPLPERVRARYREGGEVRVWPLLGVGEEDPEGLLLPGGQSLLEYHLSRGRLAPGEDPGRTVWVAGRRGERIPHLSALLHPLLGQRERALLGLEEAYAGIRDLGERMEKGLEWAERLAHLLRTGREPEPVRRTAHLLPPSRLLVAGGEIVRKPGDALEKGAYARGDGRVACLLWPGEKTPRAALEVLKRLGLEVDLRPLPGDEAAWRGFFQDLVREGLRAALVVLPPGDPRRKRFLSDEGYVRLKDPAHRAGLSLQLLRREEGEDPHRRANALLGLLLKAGWIPVTLAEPRGGYPADLVVGFDAGGGKGFRYGGISFAFLGDGAPLGWALPEAQEGERFSGESLRRSLEEILHRFQERMGRPPRRVLLLRDGFVQREEFAQALEALSARGIPYDLFSVRKNTGWRLAWAREKDAWRSLSGVLLPLEERETWLLVTADRVKGGRGGRNSPRPLLLKREAGDGPLEGLLLQIFHLSQLHPGSANHYPRLPIPLHLADRLAEAANRFGVSGLRHIPEDRIFFM